MKRRAPLSPLLILASLAVLRASDSPVKSYDFPIYKNKTSGKQLTGQHAPASSPALTPEEAQKKFILPPGFEIRLFASEPEVVNPVAMTWDERGRLWVVELYEYPLGAKPGETPRIGWLVDGEFDVVDGGSPVGRFFLGSFGVGQSVLALHVRVTDVKSGLVVYEFDMYGGSELQGRHGTVRASGLGRALHSDLQNAAERVYLTLSTDPYRYGARANVSLPE